MNDSRILVVDNRADVASRYGGSLSLDAELIVVDSSVAANERLQDGTFDLLIVAHCPPELDAVTLLEKVRQTNDRLPVLVVDAAGSVDAAAECLRLGAGDYLVEPLDGRSLQASVERLLQGHQLEAENELLRRQIERPYRFDDFIGSSAPMQKVYRTIEQVADSDVDVLVIGTTGTGKELVARSIHDRSQRASRPFVPVDCGAIPENLLESELFGHERGSFTGADARRIGLLEYANGGTFFLDELGELPLVLQAKLLRTLQERKIRRVGGRDEIDINVRVVAATSRDIEKMIRDGQFREDLYYRINVVRIELPPLRDRGDDLGLLAEYFCTRLSREMGRDVRGITPEAYQVLSQYPWPGNVRELQNIVRRGIAMANDTMIGLDDLPDELVEAAGEYEPAETLGYFQLRDQHVASFEQQYLTELLARHAGNIKTAADEAQLPRGTLYRLMKNHGLEGGAFR